MFNRCNTTRTRTCFCETSALVTAKTTSGLIPTNLALRQVGSRVIAASSGVSFDHRSSPSLRLPLRTVESTNANVIVLLGPIIRPEV